MSDPAQKTPEVSKGNPTGSSAQDAAAKAASSKSYFRKLTVLFILAAAAMIYVLVRQFSGDAELAASGQYADEIAGVESRVTLIAVGDNVPGDVIAEAADAKAGAVGDGAYDYRFIFEHIKPGIQAADLAYIDQETHVGGNKLGPKGYPSFNTTDEMADAVVDAGFDLVASATNHSYDWGPFGAVEHSREVWNSKPVAFTGTATSWQEAYDIPVIERNGIKFGFINYTYGLNGYKAGDIEGYYVNFIDEERIRVDVSRAREKGAEVIIAAMHWGTEYENEPNDFEKRYAQQLADLGVDVVLGSHPHVIQPMTWVEGEQGNRTLVCYSLGNFAIQHSGPSPQNYLEGMLSCTFIRYREGSAQERGEGDDSMGSVNDAGVRVENVKWIPIVYHGIEGDMSVWYLSDYSNEMAKDNPAFKKLDDPMAWLNDETERVVNSLGNDFEIAGSPTSA